MSIKFRQQIQHILASLPENKVNALKQLFWTELNYDRANTPLSTRNWSVEISEAVFAPPLLFASAGDSDGFHVIFKRAIGD